MTSVFWDTSECPLTVTRRDRVGGSLTMDKSSGRVEVVLSSVEGAEHDIN